MKNYLHAVARNGKTYHYFRPGDALRKETFPAVRLSDDPVEAAEQAAVLARLRPETTHGELYRHIGTLMKEGRRRARTRGLTFTLTEAQLFQMLKGQDNRCAVSGLEFDLSDPGDAFRRPFAPSLDRINSRAGYTIKNVRIVCCAVNVAMNEWGLDTFLKVAAATANRNGLSTSIGK